MGQFNQILELELLPFDKISEIIRGYSEIDKFEIGDTAMNLLENKTSLIDRNVVTDNFKNREVLISISPEYIKKLNVSCINITQLPMLVKPNSPDEKGKYLPYIHGEISHIYNSFDSIVKHKHDLKEKVENQNVLNKTVNYLNENTFTINNDVLDFTLLEWENEDSKIFKGLNKLQDIVKSDSLETRKKKNRHTTVNIGDI